MPPPIRADLKLSFSCKGLRGVWGIGVKDLGEVLVQNPNIQASATVETAEYDSLQFFEFGSRPSIC